MNEERVEATEAPEADVSERPEPQADAQPEPTPPAKDWSPEVEEEARFFGWKAPEDWKGDVPPGYISTPTEYMERLERSTPFRKAMERADKAAESARRTEQALQAAHDRDLKRQKAQYERYINDLTAQQRRAVESADTEEYDRLERLRRETPPPVEAPPQPQRADPVKEYGEAHPWVKDPFLHQQAYGIIQTALDSGQRFESNNAQIEYAETQLRQYFPHLFKAPEPQSTAKPKVDGGGMAPVSAKRTGFDTLPADAKAVFKRQVKQGLFEDTKEDREFFYNEYQN